MNNTELLTQFDKYIINNYDPGSFQDLLLDLSYLEIIKTKNDIRQLNPDRLNYDWYDYVCIIDNNDYTIEFRIIPIDIYEDMKYDVIWTILQWNDFYICVF